MTTPSLLLLAVASIGSVSSTTAFLNGATSTASTSNTLLRFINDESSQPKDHVVNVDVVVKKNKKKGLTTEQPEHLRRTCTAPR